MKKWLDEKESRDLLTGAFYGRLALSDHDRPYIVPVNFVFSGEALYIHSANKGAKLDVLKANPNVCFEASEPERLVKGDKPCQYGVRYWSVLAFGTACIVDDPEEKQRALELLARKYCDAGTSRIEPEDLPLVTVIRVDIDRLTGKRNV